MINWFKKEILALTAISCLAWFALSLSLSTEVGHLNLTEELHEEEVSFSTYTQETKNSHRVSKLSKPQNIRKKKFLNLSEINKAIRAKRNSRAKKELQKDLQANAQKPKKAVAKKEEAKKKKDKDKTKKDKVVAKKAPQKASSKEKKVTSLSKGLKKTKANQSTTVVASLYEFKQENSTENTEDEDKEITKKQEAALTNLQTAVATEIRQNSVDVYSSLVENQDYETLKTLIQQENAREDHQELAKIYSSLVTQLFLTESRGEQQDLDLLIRESFQGPTGILPISITYSNLELPLRAHQYSANLTQNLVLSWPEELTKDFEEILFKQVRGNLPLSNQEISTEANDLFLSLNSLIEIKYSELTGNEVEVSSSL